MKSTGFILYMPVMNGISWLGGSCRETERYDGYLQLENGVGMLRLLEEQVREALGKREGGSQDCKHQLCYRKAGLSCDQPIYGRNPEKVPRYPFYGISDQK